MRITRRGERMSAYKKTITYTQVMAIVIGMCFLGVGLFSMMNPTFSLFSGEVALLMTMIGVFILLFGIMTPLGQLFNLDTKMAFGFSSVIVLIFALLIFWISMNIEGGLII